MSWAATTMSRAPVAAGTPWATVAIGTMNIATATMVTGTVWVEYKSWAARLLGSGATQS